MPVNVAFSAGFDVEGAPPERIVLPPEARLVRLPTQEAVTLVGIRAYQHALVDLCRSARIGLLVARPPGDFLDEATAARLRDGGTRILGYADDDAAAAGLDAAALGRIFDRFVTPREVPWATEPLPALPEREIVHEVVFVGEADARWTALVERLRAAGMNVIAKGTGWEGGAPSPAQKLELYARTAVVLTAGGPGATRRVLETAMLGVFQIAPDVPFLRRYFPEDEVPSWGDPETLVERVEAALADPAERKRASQSARERALREHTWTARWPDLVGDLAPPVASEPPGPAPLFDQLVLALASQAEARDRPEAAAALFEELLARVPDEPTAAAGLGRCLRDLGRGEEAIAPLRIAAAATPPLFAGARAAGVTPAGAGTGLGRLGVLPPAAEPTCFLLATLVEIGRLDEAIAAAGELTDPVLLDAVTRALGGDLPPELKEKLVEQMDAHPLPAGET